MYMNKYSTLSVFQSIYKDASGSLKKHEMLSEQEVVGDC